MNVEALAIERATSNLPLKNAKNLDDVEQKIVSFIEIELKKSTEEYYDQIKSFENRVKSLRSSHQKNRLEAITETVKSDFEAIVLRDLNNLHIAREAVKDAEKDLKQFKKEHTLNRPAKYPDSRFLYFAVAGLLLLIETSINGMFFAQGHEMGLLGGAFIAFIPSGINVISGYFFGNFACRLMNHKRPFKKLFGFLMGGALIPVILVINLLIAHFRSAMSGANKMVSEQAADYAFQTFSNSPLGLDNIESWLLFIVGCLFFTISSYDFWKMDDPYLNYGEVKRSHARKLQEYANVNEYSLLDLHETREDAIKKINLFSHSIEGHLHELASIQDAKERWDVLYKDHKKHLENVANELLQYYRSINTQYRNEPAPKYFEDQWKVPSTSNLDINLNVKSEITLLNTLAKEADKKHSKQIKEIEKFYKDAFTRYPTIEQLGEEKI